MIETAFLYSDDGKEWKRSACFIGDKWSSESAVVELEDGILRFFYRNGSSRLCYADFDVPSDTWGETVNTVIAANSNCQISAIIHSKTMEGRQVILVRTCPAGPGGAGSDQSAASCRLNGRIFAFAVEEDKSLRKVGTIEVAPQEARFMHSCLTELKDGGVGILYEAGESQWGVGEDCYYTMDFRKYDLSDAMGLVFDIE